MFGVPYPTYKSTGIEWVARVPSTWNVRSLKLIYDVQLGKMLQPRPESQDDLEVPYLKALNVTWQGVNTKELPTMWASKNDLQKYTVQVGDLLVCEGGEVGRASIVESLESINATIIQNAVHRIRSETLGDVRYLKHVLESVASADWFSVLCNKATIAHLTSEKLGAIRVPNPPISEQQKIVEFLEYKTSQIDALIGKKRALIEKLNEKRTAVITQAVTKGLDPDVPMKDSGVEWLGEVPEHWGMFAVKFGLEIPITDGPHETPTILDDGVPFLSAEAVSKNCLDFDKKRGYISQEDHEIYSKKFKPQIGDVFMVKSGATTGKVARVETDEEFNIWSPLAALRPNQEMISTDFLFYFMNSTPFRHAVELGWNYGTQQNIGMSVIANLTILAPPIEEQVNVIAFVKAETSYVDSLISKADKTIIRLREYRTSLITAAVTGKIDVRDFGVAAEVLS